MRVSSESLKDTTKSSKLEEAQLISEMQRLVEVKGLSLELNDVRKRADMDYLAEVGEVMACPSCIACTCMICW